MTSDWWYQLPCLRVPHHSRALSLVSRVPCWLLIGWLASCHQLSCSQSSNSPHKCTTIWTKATHIFAPCSFICIDRQIFHISHSIPGCRVTHSGAGRDSAVVSKVQWRLPGPRHHSVITSHNPPDLWFLTQTIVSYQDQDLLHSGHMSCGQGPPSPVTASASVLQVVSDNPGQSPPTCHSTLHMSLHMSLHSTSHSPVPAVGMGDSAIQQK